MLLLYNIKYYVQLLYYIYEILVFKKLSTILDKCVVIYY